MFDGGVFDGHVVEKKVMEGSVVAGETFRKSVERLWMVAGQIEEQRGEVAAARDMYNQGVRKNGILGVLWVFLWVNCLLCIDLC